VADPENRGPRRAGAPVLLRRKANVKKFRLDVFDAVCRLVADRPEHQ
jgi:hypothetical protein